MNEKFRGIIVSFVKVNFIKISACWVVVNEQISQMTTKH